MKESYNKGLADHIDPESCLDRSRGRWGSVDRGTHRRAIELRKHLLPEVELVGWCENNTYRCVMRVAVCSGGVRELGMCGRSLHGNWDTSERSLYGT